MLYQVVNKHGNPAGRDDDDLAVFRTCEAAKIHVRFLQHHCTIQEPFVIIPVKLTKKRSQPKVLVEYDPLDTAESDEEWFKRFMRSVE